MLVTEEGNIGNKKTIFMGGGRGFDEELLREGLVQDYLKGESASTFLSLIEVRSEVTRENSKHFLVSSIASFTGPSDY